ncbi:MAG: hypothetical protein ACFFCM_16510 [Promethearchaeota archaeon]
MNCEDCGNEATIHYCLECDVLRNSRIKRSPVELAAEDLFKLCCDIYDDKQIGFDNLLEIRWMKLERLVEKLKKIKFST